MAEEEELEEELEEYYEESGNFTNEELEEYYEELGNLTLSEQIVNRVEGECLFHRMNWNLLR